MDVLKTASYNDTCRQCGAWVPDDGGCIVPYLCHACCSAAGHRPPWSKPAAATRAAAAPSAAMLKRTIPDSFAGTLVQRACEQCGGPYESTVERPCNACLGGV